MQHLAPSFRHRSAAAVGAALCSVALLAAAGCSGGDDASPDREATTSPTAEAPAEVPSRTPSPTASTAGGLTEADLPAPAGLRLAQDLDTNAPVDGAALPEGLSPGQVQEMRRAWNERGTGEDAARGAKEPYCAAGAEGTWLGVTRVEGSEGYVLMMGVGEEGTDAPVCTLEDALVAVDTTTSDVLGDDQVALLL